MDPYSALYLGTMLSVKQSTTSGKSSSTDSQRVNQSLFFEHILFTTEVRSSFASRAAPPSPFSRITGGLAAQTLEVRSNNAANPGIAVFGCVTYVDAEI